MNIVTLESGPVDTNGYLVYDDKAKIAVVVDCPYGSAEPFLQLLCEESLQLAAILLTHSHWDHTADAPTLQKMTQAPIYCHAFDEYRLTNPMEHTLWELPFEIESMNIDVYLQDSTTISFSPELTFSVIHTPGHTEGSVCFYSESESFAIVGDTLFQRSIGRTDLPGGDMETLLHSIQSRLFPVDESTVVLPGHGPATTIGEEKMYNPFLQPSFFR
ncbi:MAG: MBL fold metallo-hydrolase [Candidatus Kapabacteria bacterium]|nr:MBL fold metallo-hydrolase [Candidatus Kapabacteria bacterium]